MRHEALEAIAEAQEAGARLESCCEAVGLDPRTVQRWRVQESGGEDERRGPKSSPCHKLSETEREEVLRIANSPEYRDKSPKQIVPRLADKGRYVASESTFYRVLKEVGQLVMRGRAKRPSSQRPKERVATGPQQVWSWDITYLKSPISGEYFYLYMIVDVWSRMVVGYAVHAEESAELAGELLEETIDAQEAHDVEVVLHSDNGAPMKGSTMKATMERLGVIASYSRPSVSDDNPYSEALFRTLKYRPEYPHKPFESLDAARTWTDGFVGWYNQEHLHSGIGYVTPESRHIGRSTAIQAQRREVYAQAKARHPERWGGRATRAWDEPTTVVLNPAKLGSAPGQTKRDAA